MNNTELEYKSHFKTKRIIYTVLRTLGLRHILLMLNLCVMYVVLLLDLLLLLIVCFNKFCSVTVICLFKKFKNAIMKAFLMLFM